MNSNATYGKWKTNYQYSLFSEEIQPYVAITKLLDNWIDHMTISSNHMTGTSDHMTGSSDHMAISLDHIAIISDLLSVIADTRLETEVRDRNRKEVTL